MFTHLSVRHFATVDQLELEPEPGHPQQDPLSHGRGVLSDTTRENDGVRASQDSEGGADPATHAMGEDVTSQDGLGIARGMDH